MILELNGVSLKYQLANGAEVSALENVSFAVEAREKLAIVGPSGCGKSSLLSLIAGLLPPSAGQILHRGTSVTEPSRQRVVIFQNHALFPWATAIANIEFVLKARGITRGLRSTALAYLETMGLAGFAEAYPKELSGGMKQRVGLARALAADPDILLLDEPFSSLDVLTRDRLLEDVLPSLTATGKTMILVTHNIEEALFCADRVIALHGQPGRVAGVMPVTLPKTRRLNEFKRQPGFQELESRLYGWLSGQEENHAPDPESHFFI